MTDAFWAYGSILKLGDGGSPEVFTAIAEITSLTPPAMSRDEIDVTHHNSPNGWREYIPGLRDGGEVSVEANWLPSNATHDDTTGIWSTFTDDSVHNWQIELPSSLGTIEFSGFITALDPDTPLEEQGQLTFTIKVTGEVTGP